MTAVLYASIFQGVDMASPKWNQPDHDQQPDPTDEIYGQVVFYRDGIGYDYRADFWDQLRGKVISRSGFIPLEHVSHVDMSRRRVLPWWSSLLSSLFTYTILNEILTEIALNGTALIAFAVLALSVFWTETVVRIQSSGGDEVEVTGPNHTLLIASFRDLKRQQKSGVFQRIAEKR